MSDEQPQREGNSSALARHLGVSRVAVSKAIKKGRFIESITERAGRPWFTDFHLAEREWHDNVDRSRAPLSVRLSGMGASDEGEGDDEDPEHPATVLSKASAREKHWKAQLAELTYKERAGQLVNAEEVQEAIAEDYSTIRTRLLGLASKAKQRLPHLSFTDLATIDEMVREALEALAQAVAADGEDES